MTLSIMATHCCAVSFVLCVIMKPFMLIVIMLIVVILKVVLGLPSGDLFWSFFVPPTSQVSSKLSQLH